MLLLFPFTLEGRWSFVILAYNLFYSVPLSSVYRALSHDVTAAILMFQNKKTAAMLVSQASTVGVEHFLLFQEICIDAGQVSENAIQVAYWELSRNFRNAF